MVSSLSRPPHDIQHSLQYHHIRIKRPYILLFAIFVASFVIMTKTKSIVNLNDRSLTYENVTEQHVLHESMNAIDPQLENDPTKDSIKKDKKRKCVPMASWQQSHRPSCNFLHELDIRNANLLATGSYRHVWVLREFDNTKRVLKTLRYQREFDSQNFDRHRRDAVALEQLSSSDYVVDIHGFCCNSAIVDYTSDGDLTRLHVGDATHTKEDLLTIAHDVAASIADAHGLGIVHADVKPNQFLNFNGSYKLNDFNRAHFMKWNPERNETCGFREKQNWGAVSTVIMS